MSLVTEVLKWVVLVAGTGAVIAFFIHNIRSPKSIVLREAPSGIGQPISPTVLVNTLIRDFKDKKILLCRIQTPVASDHKKIFRLLKEKENPDALHYPVENGVVISCYQNMEGREEQLGKETMTFLKQHGFSEGSCLYWAPTLHSEDLFTWVLRGDNRVPNGPLRLKIEVASEPIE